MQANLLHSLLSHEFHTQNKHMVKNTLFDDAHLKVYTVINKAHDKYQHDLSIDDIKALWMADNPTATNAEAGVFMDAATDTVAATPVSLDVAKDVIENLWRQETFREIAQLSLNVSSGNLDVADKIYGLINKAKEGLIAEDDLGDPVTSDIHELLATSTDKARFKFNIETLSRHVFGIGPGEFGIVFARPETGKSAFCISLAASPGGWAEQGKTTLFLGNEEAMGRSKIRAMACWSGLTTKECEEQPDHAQSMYAAIDQHIIMKDIQEWDFNKVERYIERINPDIVVLDQLDKINLSGSFNATHEKLREVYRRAREVAKKYNVALMCVSQASVEAEGRTRLEYSMMEGSKTAKASEGDLILGIGKHTQSDDDDPNTMRFINVSKNKLSAWHGMVAFNLEANGRCVE